MTRKKNTQINRQQQLNNKVFYMENKIMQTNQTYFVKYKNARETVAMTENCNNFKVLLTFFFVSIKHILII